MFTVIYVNSFDSFFEPPNLFIRLENGRNCKTIYLYTSEITLSLEKKGIQVILQPFGWPHNELKL